MKSETDKHWDSQAAMEADRSKVNLADVAQRELEFTVIQPFLKKDWRMLEVGCGNGFSTARFRKLTKWVDAFDYSESMIDRAKRDWGEENNRFFHDNVLEPKNVKPPYDAAVCVRVLINLQNLKQQIQAIESLHKLVRPNGTIILFEGFLDGFEKLDEVRKAAGLPQLTPAKINYYSHIADIREALEKNFILRSQFHLGAYDYITRVVFPAMVGANNVAHQNQYAQAFQSVAAAFNPEPFASLSRMRGFVLENRA